MTSSTRIILVDDVCRDETVDIARQLGLDVIVHLQNKGYGGNQKTCYIEALGAGADIVVMLHPDNQYDATRIPAMIAADRRAASATSCSAAAFLGRNAAGGMPIWKYVSNRFLTIVENLAFGLAPVRVPHGFSGVRREPARTIPFLLNSDDFVFDQEVIAQIGGVRVQIGEIAGADALLRGGESSTSSAASCTACRRWGSLRYMLHRLRIRRSPKLKARRPAR